MIMGLLSIFRWPHQVSSIYVGENINFNHSCFNLSALADSYPLYAKGSNFIPMDAFVARATPEYAHSLLKSAVSANQNMIRIW